MKTMFPARGLQNALRLVGLVGLLISVSILTGLGIGIKVEERIPSGGALKVLGLLLGVFVGLGLAAWLLWGEASRSAP